MWLSVVDSAENVNIHALCLSRYNTWNSSGIIGKSIGSITQVRDRKYVYKTSNYKNNILLYFVCVAVVALVSLCLFHRLNCFIFSQEQSVDMCGIYKLQHYNSARLEISSFSKPNECSWRSEVRIPELTETIFKKHIY